MIDDTTLLAKIALALGIAAPTASIDDDNVLRVVDTFDEPVPAANSNPTGSILIIGNLE
ncbi:MAG: hypothetical protein IAG13_28190 [Deltaproteobacteria bacterium]|nr:hypothetical protein [Nannocystaceae bacterium]